jgi:hypothetical protein
VQIVAVAAAAAGASTAAASTPPVELLVGRQASLVVAAVAASSSTPAVDEDTPAVRTHGHHTTVKTLITGLYLHRFLLCLLLVRVKRRELRLHGGKLRLETSSIRRWINQAEAALVLGRTVYNRTLAKLEGRTNK